MPVWAVDRSYNNACGLGVRDQALGLSVSRKKCLLRTRAFVRDYKRTIGIPTEDSIGFRA